MHPLLLPSNQPRDRFYQGGSRISEFRAEPPSPPNTPEDWIGSTTSVRGTADGQTRLPDGTMLADAIAADPVGWLGQDHIDRYGIDTMLLVKLLDAGQRLPVHAHPDGAFAAQHVGARHGKAEAWLMLTGGSIHLGLTREVSFDELHAIVTAQDTEALLALMHRVRVEAGDSVYVPPGLLHSIGSGILIVEVQEPEDLSILLEWDGFDLDGTKDGHLDLGFEVALEAVERHGRDEVESLIRRGIGSGSVLPAEAAPFFRLDRVSGSSDIGAGFAIVIALGDGTLTLASGEALELRRGVTMLVPFAAGALRVDGDAIVARPPAAER